MTRNRCLSKSCLVETWLWEPIYRSINKCRLENHVFESSDFLSNLRKRTRARCIYTCVCIWRYCFHGQGVACIFRSWKCLPHTTAQDTAKFSAFLNTHVLLYVFEYICVYRYMYVFISIPRCSFRKRSFLQVWSIRQDVACIFRSGEWYRIVGELRYEETENVVL